MDRMAETLGLDPADVRARNLIPADAFPSPVGMWFRDGAPLTYDSGDYPELLRRALEPADYAQARREQAALRARGLHRGIGVAICVEGVGLGMEVLAQDAVVGRNDLERALDVVGEARNARISRLLDLVDTRDHRIELLLSPVDLLLESVVPLLLAVVSEA